MSIADGKSDSASERETAARAVSGTKLALDSNGETLAALEAQGPLDPQRARSSTLDLDIDLNAPGLPRGIRLSPEERAALGPLANLQIRRLSRGSDAEE